MPIKITLIVAALCFAFIVVWYLGFIPESLVPFMFVIIIIIALHVLIDVLLAIWEALYKLISKNKKRS